MPLSLPRGHELQLRLGVEPVILGLGGVAGARGELGGGLAAGPTEASSNDVKVHHAPCTSRRSTDVHDCACMQVFGPPSSAAKHLDMSICRLLGYCRILVKVGHQGPRTYKLMAHGSAAELRWVGLADKGRGRW